MDDDQRYQQGIALRKAVVGEKYVDGAIARTTEQTADFQSLINRYVWGETWSRPGLDIPTRRLIVIVMLVALGQEEELELHLQSAIEHGIEIDTLKEALLQTAIYCGIPAANKAFRVFASAVEKTRDPA